MNRKSMYNAHNVFSEPLSISQFLPSRLFTNPVRSRNYCGFCYLPSFWLFSINFIH